MEKGEITTDKFTELGDSQTDNIHLMDEIGKANADTGTKNWIHVKDGGDFFIYQNGPYILVNDCGVRSLYKQKENGKG